MSQTVNLFGLPENVHSAFESIAQANRKMADAIATSSLKLDFPEMAFPKLTDIVTPEMRTTPDEFQQLGQKLAEEYRRQIPTNLHDDVFLGEMMDVAEKHFVPIAWVCPGDLVQKIVKARSITQTYNMLHNNCADVLRLCRLALEEVDPEWRSQSREALSLMDSQQWSGAQALATVLLDGFLTERERRNESIPHKTHTIPHKIAKEVNGFNELADFLTFRPLAEAFRKFDEPKSSKPQWFSRHATVHRGFDPTVLGVGPALVSGMLLVAVLRRFASVEDD